MLLERGRDMIPIIPGMTMKGNAWIANDLLQEAQWQDWAAQEEQNAYEFGIPAWAAFSSGRGIRPASRDRASGNTRTQDIQLIERRSDLKR